MRFRKGLECSRRATHKWLSQALKGGAGPAHRWCGEEDAPGLPLVVRDSQGNFTADPQCVAEMCAHEWKREWGGEDAIGFVKEMNSIRALCEKMSQKLVCGPATSIHGLNRVPQTATRVAQVSEWITMWRGFNVDTRRRIRKVWRKNVTILAKEPRRWNQTAGPISAICSVLDAGWKPNTPR